MNHEQRTVDFLKEYNDEIEFVRKRMRLPERCFAIDTVDMSSNGYFSEVSFGTDVHFLIKLDWDVLPTNLSREQTFKIGILEILADMYLIRKMYQDGFDNHLPEDRRKSAEGYMQGLVQAFSGKHPKMRFKELIVKEYNRME